MLINLRNALMAGKRWKNPYVTDGLVAMYDAEWNVGGGVHDASATVWKDLAGACDLSVDLTQAEWNDKNLKVTGTTCTNATGVSSIMAIEYVCRDGASVHYANNEGPYFIIGKMRGPSCIWYGHISSGGARDSTNLSSNAASVPGKNVLCTRAATFSDPAYFYCNGKPVPVYRPPTEITSFSGSKADARRSSAFYVYCIRAYSRIPSDSEFASNYAIDKARFGLP